MKFASCMLGSLLSAIMVISTPACADKRFAGAWMRVSGHETFFTSAIEAFTIDKDMNITATLWHASDPTCDPSGMAPPDLCGGPTRKIEGKRLVDEKEGEIRIAPDAKASAMRADARDDFFGRPFRLSPGAVWAYSFREYVLFLQKDGTFLSKMARVEADLPALVHAMAVTANKPLYRQSCWINAMMIDDVQRKKYRAFAQSIYRIRTAIVVSNDIARVAHARAQEAKTPAAELLRLEKECRRPMRHTANSW